MSFFTSRPLLTLVLVVRSFLRSFRLLFAFFNEIFFLSSFSYVSTKNNESKHHAMLSKVTREGTRTYTKKLASTTSATSFFFLLLFYKITFFLNIILQVPFFLAGFFFFKRKIEEKCCGHENGCPSNPRISGIQSLPRIF